MTNEQNACDLAAFSTQPPGAKCACHDPAHAHLEVEAAAADKKIENLEVARVTHRRIGMAIGLIMAQLHVTEEQAFEILRQHSMHSNRKIAALAEDVIDAGRLEPLE